MTDMFLKKKTANDLLRLAETKLGQMTKCLHGGPKVLVCLAQVSKLNLDILLMLLQSYLE